MKTRRSPFKWEISKDEYREQVYFCRQYGAKRARAAELLSVPISTPVPEIAADGTGVLLPRGKKRSDPVARVAETRELLLRDCALIEHTARVVGGDLSPWLLKSVTQVGGVQSILIDCPCSQAHMYRLRRKFFCILRDARRYLM